MEKRPIYTKESALAAIKELVKWSAQREEKYYDNFEMNAFIDEHPWTLRHLSVSFDGAEQFADNLCAKSNVAVKELPLSETCKKYRAKNHMPEQIRFIVYLNEPDFWEKYYRIFSFESFNGIEYTCING